MVDNVKGKELHMHRYKKYHRLCLNSMIDSVELFLFTVIFLQPFALFSFSCSFSVSLSLNTFSCYILWFLHHFLHPRVSQVFRVSLSPFALPWISTLSCKATCLLFRHHLYINAARELAGQHLMRR